MHQDDAGVVVMRVWPAVDDAHSRGSFHASKQTEKFSVIVMYNNNNNSRAARYFFGHGLLHFLFFHSSKCQTTTTTTTTTESIEKNLN